MDYERQSIPKGVADVDLKDYPATPEIASLLRAGSRPCLLSRLRAHGCGCVYLVECGMAPKRSSLALAYISSCSLPTPHPAHIPEYAALLQYNCPGFLRNRRQLRMGGLAIIDVAQQLANLWAAGGTMEVRCVCVCVCACQWISFHRSTRLCEFLNPHPPDSAPKPSPRDVWIGGWYEELRVARAARLWVAGYVRRGGQVEAVLGAQRPGLVDRPVGPGAVCRGLWLADAHGALSLRPFICFRVCVCVDWGVGLEMMEIVVFDALPIPRVSSRQHSCARFHDPPDHPSPPLRTTLDAPCV